MRVYRFSVSWFCWDSLGFEFPGLVSAGDGVGWLGGGVPFLRDGGEFLFEKHHSTNYFPGMLLGVCAAYYCRKLLKIHKVFVGFGRGV